MSNEYGEGGTERRGFGGTAETHVHAARTPAGIALRGTFNTVVDISIRRVEGDSLQDVPARGGMAFCAELFWCCIAPLPPCDVGRMHRSKAIAES